MTTWLFKFIPQEYWLSVGIIDLITCFLLLLASRQAAVTFNLKSSAEGMLSFTFTEQPWCSPSIAYRVLFAISPYQKLGH